MGLESGPASPSTAGGQLEGLEDFADFTSAPPLLPPAGAAQPAAPAVPSRDISVVAETPPMRGSLPGFSPAPAAGGAPLFRAVASDAPHRAASAPAAACGLAARTAQPVGGAAGTAAADLSAMLSQQANLLDL